MAVQQGYLTVLLNFDTQNQ